MPKKTKRAPTLSPNGLRRNRRRQAPRTTVPTLARLTQREAEVRAWVTKGKTNPEIGMIRGISPQTVKKHLEHIYQKLGVETRTAAAMLVLVALAREEHQRA